jgi:hypothetical protein
MADRHVKVMVTDFAISVQIELLEDIFELLFTQI